MPTHWPPKRALAQAEIRYFVIAENVEADFDSGGLDDDKRLTNAVLEHFGMNTRQATHPPAAPSPRSPKRL